MRTTEKALFLDRDGTLIEHVPYLHDPAGVCLVPGARDSLRLALDAGFRLFLFTNQSGVGRGMYTLADVEACNLRMTELLDLGETVFDRICVAPEMPGDASGYRKPNPRFILEMMEDYNLDSKKCWMIGDSDCDAEAASGAKIGFFRVGGRLSLVEAVHQAVASASECS